MTGTTKNAADYWAYNELMDKQNEVITVMQNQINALTVQLNKVTVTPVMVAQMGNTTVPMMANINQIKKS